MPARHQSRRQNTRHLHLKRTKINFG